MGRNPATGYSQVANYLRTEEEYRQIAEWAKTFREQRDGFWKALIRKWFPELLAHKMEGPLAQAFRKEKHPTVKEHLEKFPIGYRELVLKYLDPINENYEVKTPAEALELAFYWDETGHDDKTDHDFWVKLHNYLDGKGDRPKLDKKGEKKFLKGQITYNSGGASSVAIGYHAGGIASMNALNQQAMGNDAAERQRRIASLHGGTLTGQLAIFGSFIPEEEIQDAPIGQTARGRVKKA